MSTRNPKAGPDEDPKEAAKRHHRDPFREFYEKNPHLKRKSTAVRRPR